MTALLRLRAVQFAAISVAAFAWFSPAPASAAALPVGQIELTQCLNSGATGGCAESGLPSGFNSTVNAITASPDDRFVYMGTNNTGGTSDGFDQIQAFAVGARGALTPLGCKNTNGTGGCGGVNLLSGQGVNDLTVSPDGKHLYVVTGKNTASNNGRLLVFSIDQSTGQLGGVQSQCMRDDSDPANTPACPIVANVELSFPTAVTVSPDNRFVYVGTAIDSTITVFERNTSSGNLAYASCQVFTGASSDCGVVTPAYTPNGTTTYADNLVSGIIDLEVTPDGRQLMVGTNDKVVAAFSRSSLTGTINGVSAGCVSADVGDTGCVTGLYGLDIPQGIAMSRDGGSMYVASVDSDAVTRLVRNDATGALSFGDCRAASPGGGTYSTACSTDATLVDARKVGVTADNSGVVVVGNSFIRSYNRANDGTLTAAGVLNSGFSEARALSVSSASGHVYFGSWRGGEPAPSVIQVGRAPRCATHTPLTAPYGGTATVPADRCVDANLDPVSYSVDSQATNGSVTVNPGLPAVAATYAATLGKWGADAFTLTATDGATPASLPVTVDVAAPADIALTTVTSTIGAISIGRDVTASMRLTNAGPAAAGPITLVGSGMQDIRISGAGVVCSTAANCTVASLAAGATLDLTVLARINSIGTEVLKVAAANGGAELSTANDTATASFLGTFARDIPIDEPFSSVSIFRRIGVRNQTCGTADTVRKACAIKRTTKTMFAGKVTPVPTATDKACAVRLLVQRKVGKAWRTVVIRGAGSTTCAVKSGAWVASYAARKLPVGSVRVRATVLDRVLANPGTSRWLYLRVR